MSLGFTALCYLAAWENGEPVQGEMAFADELASSQLDYSVASLMRIDTLLDVIREKYHPRHEDIRASQEVQCFLFLLAFYTGEVIGRSLGVSPQWLTYDEVVEGNEGLAKMLGGAFEAYVAVRFPGAPNLAYDYFMPLNALSTRIYEGPDEKSVYDSAASIIPSNYHLGQQRFEERLPPLPPQSLPIDLQAGLGRLSATELSSLSINVPNWAQGDKLMKLFSVADALFDGGYVVWGALVQANNLLFQSKKDSGAPGEVLYDPNGRISQDHLQAFARDCFQLKGKQQLSPDLQKVADYLSHELMRVFALNVPLRSYPLKISTTYFDQNLLPDYRIAMGVMPLLINAKYPGVVRPLPHIFWPNEFKHEWLGGEPKNPKAGQGEPQGWLVRPLRALARLFGR